MLASVFTALQGFEYAEVGSTLSDGAFGSCFFFATGLHGAHGTKLVGLGPTEALREIGGIRLELNG